MTDQDFNNESMDIARKASAKHPEDVTAAAKLAMRTARQRDWYAEFAEERELRYWRELIHDVRHAENVKLRRSSGEYGGPAKVTVGPVVARVARSVYLHKIDGRTLGGILGSELDLIAGGELARSNGHLFNVALCRTLRPLVADDKSVQECVPEKKLQKIYDGLLAKEEYKVGGDVTVVSVKPDGPVSVTTSPNGRTVMPENTKRQLSGRKTEPDAKALAGD